MKTLEQQLTQFDNQFMQPIFYETTWLEFMEHYCIEGDEENYQDEYKNNPNGKIWIAQLSANGYLDCTGWCIGETFEDVAQQLIDLYGTE